MATYSCNQFVAEYLIGRDFEPISHDYRYYVFDDTESLQDALEEMPVWMLISKANAWE